MWVRWAKIKQKKNIDAGEKALEVQYSLEQGQQKSLKPGGESMKTHTHMQHSPSPCAVLYYANLSEEWDVKVIIMTSALERQLTDGLSRRDSLPPYSPPHHRPLAKVEGMGPLSAETRTRQRTKELMAVLVTLRGMPLMGSLPGRVQSWGVCKRRKEGLDFML